LIKLPKSTWQFWDFYVFSDMQYTLYKSQNCSCDGANLHGSPRQLWVCLPLSVPNASDYVGPFGAIHNTHLSRKIEGMWFSRSFPPKQNR
jgi:hypothetical protein